MVSLICTNGLNRSLNEYKLHEPGAVLGKSRNLVISEFEESELKHGMDIARCKLDGNTFSHASANNPMWIIRNGELIEMKADRQPIGKFDYPANFTTHHFPVQKGDANYHFIDGFSDLLGGADNKRFTKKESNRCFHPCRVNPCRSSMTFCLRNWKTGKAVQTKLMM